MITEIEINDDEMVVEWTLEHDILIPENKNIFDIYIENVEPVKMWHKYTWYEIRDAVWEKEKHNYES